MADYGGERPDVAGILADRLAAALVQHEPGWRLPRPSALARRYNVRPAEVEQAVRRLAERHLIRQLPDGQMFRSSPAECLIPVHGVPRLGATVDPMGGEITCRIKKVSWRRVPEEICRALGAGPAEPVCSVRCHWALGGEPAAISTTYLTPDAARAAGETVVSASAQGGALVLGLVPGGGRQEIAQTLPLGQPAALHLEMQPPPPSVARGLRLTAGQPASIITVRFDDTGSGTPVALMVTALRSDMFRIVVESPGDGLTG